MKGHAWVQTGMSRRTGVAVKSCAPAVGGEWHVKSAHSAQTGYDEMESRQDDAYSLRYLCGISQDGDLHDAKTSLLAWSFDPC